MKINIKKFDSHTYEVILVLALFLIPFILRIIFISHYLDDWDSIQFALGIHDFNIKEHQPHPPGYPAYIFLAQLFYIIFQNDTLTLTLMSALFGSISVVFTYLLAKEFFGYEIGILSAAILSCTPAHFIFSVVAMNDIVSMSLLIVSIYLLYIGLNREKFLLLGSYLIGFTIGIRPQIFILIIILFSIIQYWKKNLSSNIYSIILFIFGCITWFIPASILNGGVIEYLTLTRSQIDAVDRFNYTFVQFEKFINLMLDGWTQIIIFFIILTTIAICLLIIEKMGKVNLKNINKPLTILFIWLLIGVFFIISLYTLYITRYLLPIFVPLSIIISYSIKYIGDKFSNKKLKIIYYSIVCVCIVIMLIQSISIVSSISHIAPAPVQAATYIEENYNHNDTIIIARDSYRHFQYYLPNFTTKMYVSNVKLTDETQITKIISESPLSFENSVKINEFYRSDNIYQKHSKVNLYEEELYNRIIADIGVHDLEMWGETPTRWITENATFIYISKNIEETNITFNVKPFRTNKSLIVFINNQIVFNDNIKNYEKITIPIHIDKGVNKIIFYCPDKSQRPCDIPELKSNDNRYLCFYIQNIYIDG
ncbi:hypothetical protein CUJ83_13970 [Methanocella sp. CWC-04]|uniref:Glycosyltransferase RgtA/B/C/D-like domain-containing protein n=1 Tax=Methanooceanicella nereidis TaxID=2052831 RepID=A0AAP2RG15_9EURY|nr:glycosyltransferase family 39 protein [Methanocella sp. CWC-04]MCD1296106.1 hypothetical protein [Methanocella sp. CWC-04]